MTSIVEIDGKRYEVRDGKYYLLVMHPTKELYYMDDGTGKMEEVTKKAWEANQAKRATKTNRSAARAIDYEEVPEKEPTVIPSVK